MKVRRRYRIAGSQSILNMFDEYIDKFITDDYLLELTDRFEEKNSEIDNCVYPGTANVIMNDNIVGISFSIDKDEENYNNFVDGLAEYIMLDIVDKVCYSNFDNVTVQPYMVTMLQETKNQVIVASKTLPDVGSVMSMIKTAYGKIEDYDSDIEEDYIMLNHNELNELSNYLGNAMDILKEIMKKGDSEK